MTDPDVGRLSSPADLREDGWCVAVHNDYRIHGERFTFWLMTKNGRAVKGEGKTDTEALNQIREQLKPKEASFAYNTNGVEWRWPHLVVWKAEVRYDPPPSAFSVVTLFCELRDRETGELRTHMFESAFGVDYLKDLPVAERTHNILREVYLKLCVHELDELLRVTDQWVDPHTKPEREIA